MDMNLWTQHSVEPGASPIHLSLGGLQVWLQNRIGEIWIAHSYEEEPGSGPGKEPSPPENLQWARWAYNSEMEAVRVTPVFPDLPVVISSEFPLTISPGAKIQIFSRIPVWMRLEFGQRGYILKEIPSIPLSKTWFGTPLEGELCYWYSTKARRSLEGVKPMPYYVNCPIWITNRDSEDLHFEKFCLRVGRLGIYRFEDKLWAGETQIVHHGDEDSEISITGKLPSGMGSGEQLSKPRNPLQRSLATRTFKKLFDDTFI